MKVQVNKVTALIKQTRYVEIEISNNTGCDMPATIDECVRLSEDLRNNPLNYVEDNVDDWELEEQTVSDIKFT